MLPLNEIGRLRRPTLWLNLYIKSILHVLYTNPLLISKTIVDNQNEQVANSVESESLDFPKNYQMKIK
jgi:hypothetical protein